MVAFSQMRELWESSGYADSTWHLQASLSSTPCQTPSGLHTLSLAPVAYSTAGPMNQEFLF